jgi:hypothetical protein
MVGAIKCGEFNYSGDSGTLGKRWQTWLDRFDLYVTANEITDEAVKKASFVLLMGAEAFEIYSSKKKDDNSESFTEVRKFMSDHFVVKKSEYAEVVSFRNAKRRDGETINEYVIRLRAMAAHCGFGAGLEKEIERQLVVGCEMLELQNKCTRTDDLNLAKILELAVGYERLRTSMHQLKGESNTRTIHQIRHQTPAHQTGTRQNNRKPKPGQCG